MNKNMCTFQSPKENEIHYGFTYKLNNKKPEMISEDDYSPILHLLAKKGNLVDFIYEKDRKGRLHVHGVVTFKGRTPLFRNMCPKGFHSHFEEVYDYDGWVKYLYKDYFRNNVIE